jgi:hypothetical protein
MGAIFCSETYLNFQQTTRRYIPEDSNLLISSVLYHQACDTSQYLHIVYISFILILSSNKERLQIIGCIFPTPENTKLNSVVVIRDRTIPTERQPLIGEVSSKVCEQRVSRGQRNGSPRPYSRFSTPEPLLFLPSSSSIVIFPTPNLYVIW